MIDNLTDLYTYYNELNYILSYGIDAHFDEDIYNKALGKKRTADVKNVYSLIEEYYKMANLKKNKVSQSKNSKREIDTVIDYEENNAWTNYMYTWYGISKNYTHISSLPRIDTFMLYEKVFDIINSSDEIGLYLGAAKDVEEKQEQLVEFALEDYHKQNKKITKNNENKLATFVKECFDKQILKCSGERITFHQNILHKFENNNLIQDVYEITDIFCSATALSPLGYFLKRNILNFSDNAKDTDNLRQNYMKIKGNSMYFSFCNELIYRSLYAVANGRYVRINDNNYIVIRITLKQDGMFGTSEYPILIAYNTKNSQIEEIELNEEYLEVGDRYKDNKLNIYNKTSKDNTFNAYNNQLELEVYFYIEKNTTNSSAKHYIAKRIENSNWELEYLKLEEEIEKYDIYSKQIKIYDKYYYKALIGKKKENDFIKWINSFGDYAGFNDVNSNNKEYRIIDANKKIAVSKRENSEFDKSLFSPLYSVCMDEYKKEHDLFIPTNTQIYWLNNILENNKTMCRLIIGDEKYKLLSNIINEYINDYVSKSNANNNICNSSDSDTDIKAFNPFKCVNINNEKVLDINEYIEISETEQKIIPSLIRAIKNNYIMEYQYPIRKHNAIVNNDNITLAKSVIYPYRIEIDLINNSKGLMAYDLINEKIVYIKLENVGAFINIKYHSNIDDYYNEQGYKREEIFLKEIYYFNNMACRRDDSRNVTEILSKFKTFEIDKKTKDNEVNLSYALTKKSMNKFVNDYYIMLSSKRKEILAMQENDTVLTKELIDTYEYIMNVDNYINCEYIDYFRKEIEAKYKHYYNYIKENIETENGCTSRYRQQLETGTEYSVTPKEIGFMITSIKMYQSIYEYLIGYDTKGKKISDKKKKLCHDIFLENYDAILREELLLRSERLKPITARIRMKHKLTISLANQIRNDLREFDIKIEPDDSTESFIINIDFESFKYRKLHMILLSWGDNIEVISPLGLKRVLELRKN